jgi:hypothetical protein
MDMPHFSYPLVDEHLGCFHLLTTMSFIFSRNLYLLLQLSLQSIFKLITLFCILCEIGVQLCCM